MLQLMGLEEVGYRVGDVKALLGQRGLVVEEMLIVKQSITVGLGERTSC